MVFIKIEIWATCDFLGHDFETLTFQDSQWLAVLPRFISFPEIENLAEEEQDLGLTQR